MINLLKLLPWIAFIIGHAFFDFYRIGKSEKPIYLQSFIIRGMAAILHALLFNPQNVVDWLPVLLFQVTSFWLFFPAFLNGLRRKPLLYVGTDSGWTDAYFLKHPFNQIIAKVAALVLMVLSTVVIYHK